MTSPIYAALGARIRARRKKLGMIQMDLSRKLKISRASVANIETGRQRVLLCMVFDIAKALRVRPADLLRGL